MAIKIGITGGIGSGKSVVSRLLGIMGIPVYISDIEAKRITQTDPVIRRGLCDLVGQDVFQGGELNRSLLASYMFGHQDHVRKVNEIIHPQVIITAPRNNILLFIVLFFNVLLINLFNTVYTGFLFRHFIAASISRILSQDVADGN